MPGEVTAWIERDGEGGSRADRGPRLEHEARRYVERARDGMSETFVLHEVCPSAEAS